MSWRRLLGLKPFRFDAGDGSRVSLSLAETKACGAMSASTASDMPVKTLRQSTASLAKSSLSLQSE